MSRATTAAVDERVDTLDELEYFRNGGILHYVLRNLAKVAISVTTVFDASVGIRTLGIIGTFGPRESKDPEQSKILRPRELPAPFPTRQPLPPDFLDPFPEAPQSAAITNDPAVVLEVTA